MSDAQKLMAEVAADHTHSIDFDFCYCGAQFISGDGITGDGVADWSAHLAIEIDKAFDGLHRITQPEYPELWEAGEKICDAGRPVSRWVSSWARDPQA